MIAVTLVSGGLDSTVMSLTLQRNKVRLVPIFIDYGQRARKREWAACRRVHRAYELPVPRKVSFSGLGRAIKCGLTSADYDVFADAFLPGRNLYFLLIGASIAIQRNADAIAIGLLSEKRSQFPDQTKRFIQSAERVIHVAMGRRMKLLTPLMDLEKREVVRLASAMKVRGTYSCHAGGKLPCGVCIACREYS